MNMHVSKVSPDWLSRLSPYKVPDNRRATIELALTAILFAGFWVLMWAALQYSIWLGLLTALLPGGMIVRLFAIQHDCGHGALFSSPRVNDWIGRVIGVFTMTPYDYWRHSHALHHAASGNLDRRGFGDIETLTVAEFMALSFWGRWKYRLYRNPIVLFGIGPAFIFFLKQRLPFEALRKGWAPWISTLGTNAGIAALLGGLIYFVGWRDVLIIQCAVIVIGATAGVWLFYVQHQYEETLWERKEDWDREHLALQGSSFYDLPKPLMWLTGNIGIHHVHHLSSRIPFHRLPQIMKDYPELKNIGRLTFWESIKCVKLSLWDENSKQLISFRQLSQLKLEPVSARI